MRVAIALWFRSPMGGLHENIRATARHLVASGHEVVVFCPPGPFADSLAGEGISVIRTDYSDTALLLQRARQQPRFDIIHAHPGPSRHFCLQLAARSGSPLFITLHGRWLDQIESYADRCAGIIAVSPAVRDGVLASAPAAATKVTVVWNGAAYERGSHLASTGRRVLRMAYNAVMANSQLRVVVASRFDQDKRRLTDFLLQVWDAQARRGETGVGWYIAGAGCDMPELTRAARKLHASLGRPVVRFRGWLSQEELSRLHAACDVAVSPGRSAIEAMAAGLAVVPVGSAGCAGLATPDRFRDVAYANFGGYGLQSQQSAVQIIDDLIRLRRDRITLMRISLASARFVHGNLREKEQNEKLLTLYADALKEAQALPLGEAEPQIAPLIPPLPKPPLSCSESTRTHRR